MKSLASFLIVALASVALSAPPPSKPDSYVEGTVLTVLPYGIVVDAQVLENGSKDPVREKAFLYNVPKHHPFVAGVSIIGETLRTGVWHDPNGVDTLPAFKCLRVMKQKEKAK